MKRELRNICIFTTLFFAGLVAFAQAPVDLNIGPAGQFCGAQTATEVKCLLNAYFEDEDGNNVGPTTVGFDLKANGLSTVTVAGTSYQVTSPFPAGILYPTFPQHPKAQGTISIVFTDGTMNVPYLSDNQCSAGRTRYCVNVITVLPSTSLDGEQAN